MSPSSGFYPQPQFPICQPEVLNQIDFVEHQSSILNDIDFTPPNDTASMRLLPAAIHTALMAQL